MIISSKAKSKSVDSLSESQKEDIYKGIASLFEGNRLAGSHVYSDLERYAQKFGGDQADDLLVRALRNYAEVYIKSRLKTGYSVEQVSAARNELGTIVDGENLGARFAATMKSFDKTLDRMVDSKLAVFGVAPASGQTR